MKEVNTIKKVYENVGTDIFNFEVQEVDQNKAYTLYEEWITKSDSVICYVGKHKKVMPNEDKELDKQDFDPDLLVECRMFTEDEEVYIVPNEGKLKKRVISKREYIDKEIQLRIPGDREDKPNDTLTVRHYIDKDGNGYEFLRYLKLN